VAPTAPRHRHRTRPFSAVCTSMRGSASEAQHRNGRRAPAPAAERRAGRTSHRGRPGQQARVGYRPGADPDQQRATATAVRRPGLICPAGGRGVGVRSNAGTGRVAQAPHPRARRAAADGSTAARGRRHVDRSVRDTTGTWTRSSSPSCTRNANGVPPPGLLASTVQSNTPPRPRGPARQSSPRAHLSTAHIHLIN